MHTPNFTQCGQTYMSDPALIAIYSYTGDVINIPINPLTQITYQGCRALCGSGNKYYTWTEVSATTKVLPILGTLLQAPFESTAFWRTIKAINRWIGSPISSLACILWDIKISRKCALFGKLLFFPVSFAIVGRDVDAKSVDMSIPYGDTPDQESEFASMRDSFYILMNLNQFKMKPVISMTREAEGLLRIMLFSEELRLVGKKKTLAQMRDRLARQFRNKSTPEALYPFLLVHYGSSSHSEY
jgi:hypothetical protein